MYFSHIFSDARPTKPVATLDIPYSHELYTCTLERDDEPLWSTYMRMCLLRQVAGVHTLYGLGTKKRNWDKAY